MSDDRGGKEIRRRPRHGRGGPGTADRPARPARARAGPRDRRPRRPRTPRPARRRRQRSLRRDRATSPRPPLGSGAYAPSATGKRRPTPFRTPSISAYRAAHTFRGQSAVTTWLHRITVNACLDSARKASSRRTSLTDDSERLDLLLEPHEAADIPAERQDLHRQLVAALSELPAEQRAALVLVDMQGYPVAEAADVLGVAVGTVKSRCARGRARLLPLVSHLRPYGDERSSAQQDRGRNRTRGASVQPSEGITDPPGVVKGGGEQP